MVIACARDTFSRVDALVEILMFKWVDISYVQYSAVNIFKNRNGRHLLVNKYVDDVDDNCWSAIVTHDAIDDTTAVQQLQYVNDVVDSVWMMLMTLAGQQVRA